jgi:hypothetical protein
MRRAGTGKAGRSTAAGATAAALLALVLVLHVWWPLVATVSVLVIAIGEVALGARPFARFLVILVAIAGIAVTFEADRLKFGADRTYVYVANAVRAADMTGIGGRTQHDIVDCVQQSRRLCGVLIENNALGLYLAIATGSAPAEHVAFIPRQSIEGLSIEKATARVIPSSEHSRRKALRFRIWDAP